MEAATKEAKSRIYKITTTGTDAVRLVDATNSVQAVNTAAKGMFSAKVASQQDLIAALQAGVKVEKAGEPIAE